jgi:hypothetical protein
MSAVRGGYARVQRGEGAEVLESGTMTEWAQWVQALTDDKGEKNTVRPTSERMYTVVGGGWPKRNVANKTREERYIRK